MPSFYRESGSIRTCAAINPADGSQTANHADSTSPTSATLSNTEAGYEKLGGRFQFLAVAGAATDYALFAFLVPAGFRLMITGIAISAVVMGAALVNAAILDWSLGIGSPGESLQTSGLIRIPLGVQGFLALTGIGDAAAPDLIRRFRPELVVEHGKFVHVILQMPLGTATPLLTYRGDVLVQGYFESVI